MLHFLAFLLAYLWPVHFLHVLRIASDLLLEFFLLLRELQLILVPGVLHNDWVHAQTDSRVVLSQPLMMLPLGLDTGLTGLFNVV